jgi:hypothetical protein
MTFRDCGLTLRIYSRISPFKYVHMYACELVTLRDWPRYAWRGNSRKDEAFPVPKMSGAPRGIEQMPGTFPDPRIVRKRTIRLGWNATRGPSPRGSAGMLHVFLS